jgi:hypothetical protein
MIEQRSSRFSSPSKNKVGFFNRYAPYHVGIGFGLGALAVGSAWYKSSRNKEAIEKEANISRAKHKELVRKANLQNKNPVHVDYIAPQGPPTMQPGLREWQRKQHERYLSTPQQTPIPSYSPSMTVDDRREYLKL